MNIKKAIDMPRIHHQWLPDEINYEIFGLSEDVKEDLEKLGYKIGSVKEIGRVQGIMMDDKNRIWGATDPRGYGGVAGY